jgi:lipopolysaccharide transport system permease protein
MGLFNRLKTFNLPSESITVIESSPGLQFIDFNELREYRDLFYFLVWRDIKVLYAQTILGFSWALLQPLVQIIIFTIIFGKIARLSTEGIPYVLFSTVAIIPWTYMSQAMSDSSQSLITNQRMLKRIYFPRLILPLTAILSRMMDFSISLLLLFVVLFWYRITPTWNMLLLPLFVIQMMCLSAGFGLWASTLAVRFRDVRHAMPFVTRMLMYSAPIVYSASSLSGKYRVLYSLNPIVSVIEGFRACLLGTPIVWSYVLPGLILTIIIFGTGTVYFKSMERLFADVV